MVFECNKKSSSDYYYVRAFIQKYFDYHTFKFEKIFAGCKTELYSKSTNKKINTLLGKYISKETNVNISLIFFADVDTYSSDDNKRNKNLSAFASKYSQISKIVWFNLDIEDVFLGRRIKKDKPKEAKNFLLKKEIGKVEIKKFKQNNARTIIHSSNLYSVLSSVLPTR